MVWTVEYDLAAAKSLRKLDGKNAARVLDYMDKVALLPDPRSRGKALTGRLSGFWRFRVGDFRIICDFLDDEMIILALDAGHRSSIYR